ncbi:hypothetical protein ACFY4C_15355 [Actinomadura viridis]|uniref:hypothetical protein n=1 Tax=Actinomadura viridis TaxID=58110 RepID=UPI0036A13A73
MRESLTRRGSDGGKPLQRRAKLSGGRRREWDLRIRICDQECEEFHEAAMRDGLACSAVVVKTVRTAIREGRPANGALIALHAELRNASRQVNAVGINLNQLVRHANARGQVRESVEWLAAYCFRVVRRAEAVIVELGKILLRSPRPGGVYVRNLLRYLYGPGKRNEHTDPHIVAGYRHPAALEPARRADGKCDLRTLGEVLRSPLETMRRSRPAGPVWQCSLRTAPADRARTDEEWASPRS